MVPAWLHRVRNRNRDRARQIRRPVHADRYVATPRRLDRYCLGERVPHWLAEHPRLDIVDVAVTSQPVGATLLTDLGVLAKG
jgi:hypothetical protein